MRRSSMRGSRRRLRVVVAVAVALAVAVAATFAVLRRPHGLVNDGSHVGYGKDAEVGAVASFGLDVLQATEGVVRVREVHVTGVPDGLEILAIHAVRTGESPLIGVGDPPEKDPRIRTHPISDIRVIPGGPRGRWYLLVVARITKPGTWRTRGIDVTWQRGMWRGSTHFRHYIEMTTGQGRRPDASPSHLSRRLPTLSGLTTVGSVHGAKQQ